MTTPEAYAVCRTIARTEAKNFYWAFRVLPRAKRDAMCAVYAFMRRADDLADDESMSLEARRSAMRAWVEAWRRTLAGGTTEDAVFLALGDTQRRFGIPRTLLEELVQGVTMDLEPREVNADGVQTYQDFEELYRYCYLVASVVGLVCIRIFGYSDRRAEILAERTGIAFQLTNILRDVKEDVERGRVYLPVDLMEEFGITVGRVRQLAAGAKMTVNDRAVLGILGGRAEAYYESAGDLIPLLDQDSRAAMWVLTRIYRRLLERVGDRGGDVFRRRVRVPGREKLAILLQGAALAMRNRVLG